MSDAGIGRVSHPHSFYADPDQLKISEQNRIPAQFNNTGYERDDWPVSWGIKRADSDLSLCRKFTTLIPILEAK